MPSETEIERLVVRLVGEDSSFQKMMDRAVKEGQKLERMAMQTSKAEDRLNESMRQGAAITKASETATEKYNRTLQEMSDLYNTVDKATGKRAISQETFNRVMKDSEKLLPEFAAASKQAEAAEMERQQSARRGAEMNKAVTQSLMTNKEAYAQRAAQLNLMLAASDITTQTHAVLSMKNTANSYQELGGTITSVGAKLVMTGGLVAGAFGALGYSALNQAKEFEQTMVSFSAMLGSEAKAQKLLGDLTKFSAETPFEMPTLLSATRMLLQFQVPAKDVLGVLKSIGDVTGGSDAGKVQSMAYAFAQMSSAGKLMGQDLMQMVNAGFNPLNEMTKMSGKSMAVLKEEMSQGKISADMVKDAFAHASERLNLMAKQSQTLGGRISTLNDNVGLFWRSVGQELIPVAGYFVDKMAAITGWFQKLDPFWKKAIAYSGMTAFALGTLAATVGGVVVTSGILVSSLASTAATMGFLVLPTVAASGAMTGFALTTTGAAAAAMLLNTALVGGIIVGIGAVAYMFYQASEDVEMFNAALEKSIELNGKVVKRTERNTTAILTESNKIADPQERTAFLTDESRVAGKNVEGLSGQLEAMKKNVDSIAPSWVSLWQGGRAEWEAAKEGVEGTTKQLEAMKDRAKQLNDELIKSGGSKALEEMMAKSAEGVKEMEKNVARARDANVKAVNAFNDYQTGGSDEQRKETEKTAAEYHRLNGELKAAKENLDHLGDLHLDLDKKVSDTADKALSELKTKMKNFGKSESEVAADTLLEQTSHQIGEARQKAEDLALAIRKAGREMENIEKRDKAVKDVDAMAKSLEEEARGWGLVGNAAKLAKMQQELDVAFEGAGGGAGKGAAQEKLNEVAAGMKEQEKHQVEEMVKGLNQQAQAALLTGAALEAYNLKIKDGIVLNGEQQLALEKAHKALKEANAEKGALENVKTLREQVAVLGMNEYAAMAYKMRLDGVTESTIANTIALKQQAKEDGMVRSLQEQVTMLGMTAEAAAIYKMRLDGVSEATIGVVTQLSKQKKMMEAGKALTEKHMTPQMKMDKQKTELDELFNSGIIKADVYQKELKDIQKQADKTGSAIKAMSTVDAVGAGTADAMARINEYMSLRGSSDLNAPDKDIMDPGKVQKAGEQFGDAAISKLLSFTGQQMKVAPVPGGLIPSVAQPPLSLADMKEQKRLEDTLKPPEGLRGDVKPTEEVVDNFNRFGMPQLVEDARMENPLNAGNDTRGFADRSTDPSLFAMNDAESEKFRRDVVSTDYSTPQERQMAVQEQKMPTRDDDKGMDGIKDGIMLLVDLTRQLVGKEPVVFEGADL